jgi:hypothetical protein
VISFPKEFVVKRTISCTLFGLALTALSVGCGRTDPTPKGDGTNAKVDPKEKKAADAAKARYLLASEPAGARSVIDVRKDAKNGDQVVLVGRIGGDTTPFTQDRASFLIADTSFVPCNEKAEPEESDTPWDFC